MSPPALLALVNIIALAGGVLCLSMAFGAWAGLGIGLVCVYLKQVERL